jgi:ubiquinone biosynthesis protein
MRSELGPEAYYADRIVEAVRAFKKIPDLINRIDQYYPPAGAAPPAPPLPEIEPVRPARWWSYAGVALIAAVVGALVTWIV